jgi:hypothetical protein
MRISRSKGQSFFATALLMSVIVLLVTAPAASALTKERSPLHLATEPILLPGFCEFPITYQDLSGGGTQTLTFDSEGNFVQIFVHAHLISQLSANGNTITFNNSGTLRVVPQPDGTDLVTLTGHSQNADQGLLTGERFAEIDIGRVVIVSRFNPETGFNDFLSIERSGQSFDVCAALAA